MAQDAGAPVSIVVPPPILDREAAQALRVALASAHSRLVLLDMAQVSFLDSHCLGVLAHAVRLLEGGQRLALCNTSERVRRVLQQTGFDAFVEVHAEGDPWPWPDLVVPPPREAPDMGQHG